MYILSQDRIDLWLFPLKEYIPQAFNLLSEDEKKRANQFYFPHHKQNFTMARAILRCLLAKYLDITPSQIIFDYYDHGKPYIKHNIQFNLSHSGGWALLAVGEQYPMGVDLEYFSDRPYEGIAQTAFSPIEINHLKQLPFYLKPIGFYSLWSQKEAFIKASGLGLSYNTASFTMPILPNAKTHKPHVVWDHQHQKNWNIYTFMPKLMYSAALCTDLKVQEISFKTILPNTLILS